MVTFLDPAFDLIEDPDAVSAYDELPLWSAVFGNLLLEKVEMKPGLKVLDVGCGTGFPLIELAQRMGPSCHLTGIDPWQLALERAELKIKVFGLTNVELIHADVSAYDWKGKSFDLIVSNLGMEHFGDFSKVIETCCKLANPGARLIVTICPNGVFREIYDVFGDTLIQLGLNNLLDELNTYQASRLSLDEAAGRISQAGFEIEETVIKWHGIKYTDGTALLHHCMVQYVFLEDWKQLIPVEVQNDFFKLLQDNLNAKASNEHGLYMSIPCGCIVARRQS